MSRVAVGSAKAIVVSVSMGSTVALELSTDGGHSINSVLTTERTGAMQDRFLAFTTARVGTWIDEAGNLWRTEDAGASWVKRSLR